MLTISFTLIAVVCAVFIMRADMQRRHLRWSLWKKLHPLTVLDLTGPAIAAALAIAAAAGIFLNGSNNRQVLAALFETVAGAGIAYYLWREGTHTIQFQRPDGIVFGQFLVLGGVAHFIAEYLRLSPHSIGGWLSVGQAIAIGMVVAGAAVLLGIVPRFLKGKEEHRILDHVAEFGTSVVPEWHPATPECPHPERWRMYDSMSAEIEVLDFLERLITTLKPKLVVETGTFIGVSTLRMAKGMKANGFGKIVSCEFDPAVYARAKQSIDASGLANWIDLRNESSLETKVSGTIDIFFSDSDIPIREQEVRRFLPQISPFGLVLMHDANSRAKLVRDAALKLEGEGLLSVVLLPTPRGLVMAQKREGRK